MRQYQEFIGLVKKDMNVCISVDDNYIKPALVMLDSLFMNNKEGELHLYILYSKKRLSRFSMSLIYKLGNKTRWKLHFIEVEDSCFEGAPLVEYISITTYYRLLVAELLPIDVKKIIYLDSDIVIDGALKPLYNRNMDGHAFAGVQGNYQEQKERLNIPEKYPYINAGVLLINIEWIRQNISRKEILEYINKNLDILALADQDVINGMFYQYIKTVPAKYNYTKNYKKRPPQRKINDKRNTPIIYHFKGKLKPWSTNYFRSGNYIYWKYVNRNIKEYPYSIKIFRLFSSKFAKIVDYLRGCGEAICIKNI